MNPMSAFGTKRTSLIAAHMSAFGGKGRALLEFRQSEKDGRGNEAGWTGILRTGGATTLDLGIAA